MKIASRRHIITICGLVGLLSLASCKIFDRRPSPAETQPSLNAAETVPPAQDTPTLPAALPPTSSPLAPSSVPPQTCDPNHTLAEIRAAFPFQVDDQTVQHAETYWQVGDQRGLVLWFIDPALGVMECLPADIAPDCKAPTAADVQVMSAHARQSASLAVSRLVAQDSCIRSHFDKLDVIVVDAGANGYFSGLLDAAGIPEDPEAISAAFQNVFLRDFPSPAATGAVNCRLEEARRNARAHFAGGDDPAVNIDFYPIADRDGLTWYAQWVGFGGIPELTTEMASAMNAVMELGCFPGGGQPNRIEILVTDAAGNVAITGSIEGAKAIQNLDIGALQLNEVSGSPTE